MTRTTTPEGLKEVQARNNADFAIRVAEAIAVRKKLDPEAVKENLKKFGELSSFKDFITQCGKTAKSHGFWEAQLRTSLAKLNITYETFADWFAANIADHPEYDEEKPDPAKVQAFEEAAARGRLLSQETCIKCDTLHKLEFHGIIGDPFIFLGLVGTEVAEAMEACRKGNWYEPDGVFEELVDAVVRIFDFVERFWSFGNRDGWKAEPITPDRFVALLLAKMAVNESRPFLHGKKF